MNPLIRLAESRLLNDALIRIGIRQLLKERIKQSQSQTGGDEVFMRQIASSALAVDTDAANEQHYEVPTEYFKTVLGPHLKYSSGYWPHPDMGLKESEEYMLELTCERAQLADGQHILELGCGWGSLTLWMASKYPAATITAVSNSATQRAYIEAQCRERDLENVTVITQDINAFRPHMKADRIVSVEMFEHVRNHAQLFERIREWLTPKGKLFVHIFAHHETPYLFDRKGARDWMAEYFFTGGVMPSATLLPRCAAHLQVAESWSVNGIHYSRTLEAWLQKHDTNSAKVNDIFGRAYKGESPALWSQRWRIFYMACSELFRYNGGNEWLVMHYRFER